MILGWKWYLAWDWYLDLDWEWEWSANSLGTNREDAKLLTKGDNNVADDTELYARGQDYIERKDIIGSVVDDADMRFENAKNMCFK